MSMNSRSYRVQSEAPNTGAAADRPQRLSIDPWYYLGIELRRSERLRPAGRQLSAHTLGGVANSEIPFR